MSTAALPAETTRPAFQQNYFYFYTMPLTTDDHKIIYKLCDIYVDH